MDLLTHWRQNIEIIVGATLERRLQSELTPQQRAKLRDRERRLCPGLRLLWLLPASALAPICIAPIYLRLGHRDDLAGDSLKALERRFFWLGVPWSSATALPPYWLAS
jgi:hypothetical protein